MSRDGGEGFAAAGGHLNEGARAVLGQRLFQILDGDLLRGPEAFFFQGRQLLEAFAERGEGLVGFALQSSLIRGDWLRFIQSGFFQPFGQHFGFMKAKCLAAAWFRVEFVRKTGFHAGALVEEGEGSNVDG